MLHVVKLVYLRTPCVFGAAHVETERKEEGGRKERHFAKREGQAGRTRIPDFPVYLDAIATDTYTCDAHTRVSLLTFRDPESSGSCTAISRRSGEGQMSTDTKQSRPGFYELRMFLGIARGYKIVCDTRT